MTITINFSQFLLLIITIVIVFIGIYLVKALNQFSQAMKTVSNLLEQSQEELTSSLQNVEQITNKVDDISGQVNAVVDKFSEFSQSTDRLILRPLGSLIGGIIANATSKNKSRSA